MSLFKKIETGIKDLYLLETEFYSDERGYLFESWNDRSFRDLSINDDFIQDKVSLSKKGVLRGMHYQVLKPQAKFVRVLKGKVFDVAVDMRINSPSFGKWFGTILSEENKLGLYIPKNFAHGFLALENDTVFYYKTTNYFYPKYDRGFKYNDNKIKIKWPLINQLDIILSYKDLNLPTFDEAIEEIKRTEKDNGW